LMTSASSAKQSGLKLASAILPRCSQWLQEASFTGAAGGIAGCPVPGGQRPLGPIALHPSASRSSNGVPPLPAWPEPACVPAAGLRVPGADRHSWVHPPRLVEPEYSLRHLRLARALALTWRAKPATRCARLFTGQSDQQY
jgi:hypothetical protein